MLRIQYFLIVCSFMNIYDGLPLEDKEQPNNSFVTNIESSDLNSVVSGQNVTLVCRSNATGTLYWTFNNDNITEENNLAQIVLTDRNDDIIESQLYILNITLTQQGNYTCNVQLDDVNYKDSVYVNITSEIKVIDYTRKIPKLKAETDVVMYCVFSGHPSINITWRKDDDISSQNLLSKFTNVTRLNDTLKNTTLTITNLIKKDTGNYSCINIFGKKISEVIELIVIDKPQVSIDFIKPLSTNEVFLNWTVNDGNNPENLTYSIQYMIDGESNWVYYPEKIKGTQTVLKLPKENVNTTYTFAIVATNIQGESHKSIKNVTTLVKNLEFVPEVKVTGVTVSSITVAWSQLPQELHDHIHYYKLKLRPLNSTEAEYTEYIEKPGDHFYMFRELAAATTYEFQVTACNDYLQKCGNWSNVANGTTLDGKADPPVDVKLNCNFDNISQRSSVFVSWQPPKNPNGKITHYNVVLEGGATFINEYGITQNITWGPKMKSVNENFLNARFYNISANTNYTIKISAVTRTKKHGEHVVLHCIMPPTTPEKIGISKFVWSKVEEQGKWLFKLLIPRISERNGPICCYRIYLVKLEPHQTVAELPPPEDLLITSYEDAHGSHKGGTYIAEMFASNYFQSEIFLGDEQTSNYNDSDCLFCAPQTLRTKQSMLMNQNMIANTPSAITFTQPTATALSEGVIENQVTELPREEEKINFNNNNNYYEYLYPYDGTLNMNSNYTGFVEIIVRGNNKGESLTAYSNYFNVLSPGPTVIQAPENLTLGIIVIQVLFGLFLVVVILLVALCLLHRYSKQVAHVQGVEMITFRNSFRYLCRSLRGRHRLVSVNPPDMNSIPVSELATVYMERHRDSDYGFQREFELLPDRFSDRTTRASDARENIYKNRYPDIKAYDQTRVKLAQIDSIAGSDYINANFVMGYKERKKFICAQGPMDNTVCDFWRMIWEQHLELILMLTNLEEYSKTKCAKYWPDKTEGDKVFGDYSVTHLDENRYSDYIVRKLSISKTIPGRDKETRYVTQYHFLVWKDFMAPEHPHGIIKFIKRINEVYSLDKGSILVHCSAGVGRTGTLVALDSLFQQFNEEHQVAVFNTIVDLRHQRNFLVQSLKQYIFIYKALMELSLYGDTEINAMELKTTVDKLKQTNGKNKSKIEEDFENIKNAIEEKKSFSVGGGPENQLKNRSTAVIPYDRNRVILTPIPGREHSTYINASFIEGYDNSESFIITQDPLETTINDFWRMISEQNISIIVMLSELGDDTNKCPRYWPDADDEANYDHISVKYIQSESCPYYTHREFVVTNNKSDEINMVTQFQYHGWPTVEGEVPEVTRGLIELVDQTHQVQEQNNSTGPIVVHCNLGADRSSIFVGLSIVVQQLRIEKRVDIFTMTRKLKSQRQELISTFAQYEFLHRAIVNYYDLHQMSENS